MPKVTVEFNLPEDRHDYARSFHAPELFSACWDLDQEFRGLLKHGIDSERFKTPLEVMEYVRSVLCPILSKLDD